MWQTEGKGPEVGESGVWVEGGPEHSVPAMQNVGFLEESGKAAGRSSHPGWLRGLYPRGSREMSELRSWNKA